MNLDLTKRIGKIVVLTLATGQKVMCKVLECDDLSGVEFKYPCEYGIGQNGQEVIVPYHPYSGVDPVCEISNDFIKGVVEVTHTGTIDNWKKLTQQDTILTPKSDLILPNL